MLQGVSIDGENLIITFQVTEGPLTRIAGVEVKGNKIYTEQRLRQELRTVVGAPYSRSQARADADRVSALYAREGYLNARLDFSVVELPKKGDDEQSQACLLDHRRRRESLHQPNHHQRSDWQTRTHDARSAGQSGEPFRSLKAMFCGPIASPRQSANCISRTLIAR